MKKPRIIKLTPDSDILAEQLKRAREDKAAGEKTLADILKKKNKK